MTCPQALPARRPRPTIPAWEEGRTRSSIAAEWWPNHYPQHLASLSLLPLPCRRAGEPTTCGWGRRGSLARGSRPPIPVSPCSFSRFPTGDAGTSSLPQRPRAGLTGDLWKEWLGGLGRLREQGDLTEVTADSWSERWVSRPSPPRAHRQHQPLCVMSL